MPRHQRHISTSSLSSSVRALNCFTKLKQKTASGNPEAVTATQDVERSTSTRIPVPRSTSFTGVRLRSRPATAHSPTAVEVGEASTTSQEGLTPFPELRQHPVCGNNGQDSTHLENHAERLHEEGVIVRHYEPDSHEINDKHPHAAAKPLQIEHGKAKPALSSVPIPSDDALRTYSLNHEVDTTGSSRIDKGKAKAVDTPQTAMPNMPGSYVSGHLRSELRVTSLASPNDSRTSAEPDNQTHQDTSLRDRRSRRLLMPLGITVSRPGSYVRPKSTLGFSGSPKHGRKVSSFERGPRYMRAFINNGETWETYKSFETDQWLLTPDGDTYVHLNDHQIPTFRLDSSVIKTVKLPVLHDLIRESESTVKPHLDTEVLRQPRPGSLPLHKRISPIKWPDPAYLNSTPDVTAGLAMTNDAIFRVSRPVFMEEIHTFETKDIVFRNVLAMAYRAPLVGPWGTDLFTALRDLAEAVTYLAVQSEPQIVSDEVLLMLIDYVREVGYMDIHTSLEHALDMLAWCELPTVRWTAGYREAFVQVVGLLEPSSWVSFEGDNAHYTRISQYTRNDLFTAWSELGIAIRHAEQYLTDFRFPELVDVMGPGSEIIKESFDAFRRVIKEHYTSVYLQWPPEPEGRYWLTWPRVQHIIEEMNDLYDALVDRKVHYGQLREELNNPRTPSRSTFRRLNGSGAPDTVPALRTLAAAFDRFDTHRGSETMPLPCPLLPTRSMIIPHEEAAKKLRTKGSVLSKNGGKTAHGGKTARGGQSQIQASIALAAATRSDSLDAPNETMEASPLLQKFQRLESSTPVGTRFTIESLQDARVGRWLLIYGIMQVLSVLSVDAPQDIYKNEDYQHLRQEHDHYVWGAVRAIPPWHVNDWQDQIVTLNTARRATHPWYRYRQLLDEMNQSAQSNIGPTPRLSIATQELTSRSPTPPYLTPYTNFAIPSPPLHPNRATASNISLVSQYSIRPQQSPIFEYDLKPQHNLTVPPDFEIPQYPTRHSLPNRNSLLATSLLAASEVDLPRRGASFRSHRPTDSAATWETVSTVTPTARASSKDWARTDRDFAEGKPRPSTATWETFVDEEEDAKEVWNDEEDGAPGPSGL
ncbi:MAG: hypothetical protein Q9162_001176 [Coniocarpon cinnabarinum]